MHQPVIRLQPQSNLLLQQSPVPNVQSQQLHYSQQLSPPPQQRQHSSAHGISQPITLTSTNEVQAGEPGTSSNSSETHSLPHLDESKKNTKKRNECPFCQIVCAKPSVLDKHIRTHTNERPYPCEPCGFAFKTKSNLYKHKKSRTHNLKVEKGIDSHSEDIVAELGDGVYEERDQISMASQASISHPHPSFQQMVFTQSSSSMGPQGIVGGSNHNASISNNIRIPTMSADTRVPLILTTHGHQPRLNAAAQNQLPRFLTSSMESLRPEQQFPAPSNMYTAKPSQLSAHPNVQTGPVRLISQNERDVQPRGPLSSQNVPRGVTQYTTPATTKQMSASHDMQIASHHRAIAVASLTQVSSSSINPPLPNRPRVLMEPIRGSNMQGLQRPTLPSTDLRPSEHPHLIMSSGIREQQHQATDLSKAIRSSAAAAVRAVTQRAFPLPQTIHTPSALVKDIPHPSHQ